MQHAKLALSITFLALALCSGCHPPAREKVLSPAEAVKPHEAAVRVEPAEAANVPPATPTSEAMAAPPPSAAASVTQLQLRSTADISGVVMQSRASPSAEAFQRTIRSHAYEANAQVAPTANTERYDRVAETGFRRASEQPLSTFSVDVDTASYSTVRRFLEHGHLPPPDAVRIEELVNYFGFEAPATSDQPLALSAEVTESPFHAGDELVRISLRASAPHHERVPPRNLVFLIDVSGSMESENKLPLLKQALSLLVEQLTARDRVAIVTYAGASGVLLPPTPGDRQRSIRAAIDGLVAGGSTNGGAGIQRAYELASEQLDPHAINRVILATDGDFNVGVTDQGSLVRLIERERERGVFLTVLGFGMGNLNDATMEQLADHGNGSYAYIDTLREARKVLVEQASSTLRTIAKDTKLQIEWNPARVARYRLIGYENRRLADEDFNDDKKDAGDMGDGHTVTALYEIEPAGRGDAATQLDPLKYQQPRALTGSIDRMELMTIKVRFKAPADSSSQRVTYVVKDDARALTRAATDTRFAIAVAGFGMLLAQSEFRGDFGYGDVERLAAGALGADRDGYRAEFLTLVSQARNIARAE